MSRWFRRQSESSRRLCEPYRRELLELSAEQLQVATTRHQHFEQCTECSQWARRLLATKRALAQSTTRSVPSDFVAGVMERIDRSPTLLLGRTAWQALPALGLLLLALAVWSARFERPRTSVVTNSARAMAQAPSANALAWLLVDGPTHDEEPAP